MNNSSIESLTHRANTCLASGQLNEAKLLFSELCEKESNNEEHWLTLAAIYGETDDNNQAIECANKAIELDATYVEAYLTKALLLDKLGNREEAFNNVLQAVERDDTYDEAMVFLTGLAGRMKRFEEAEHWANKTINLMPGNIAALLNLGNAQYELSKFEEAENTFYKVLEQDANNQAAILGLARAAHAQGFFDKSITLLKPLVATTTISGYAEDLLATCLIGLEKEDEAYEILERLIKSHPNFVGSYIHIASILENRGDYFQAINYLNFALRNAVEPLEVLNELARLCHEYGMHKESIENCKKALEIEPGNKIARFYLALALSDSTHFEEALATLDDLYPEVSEKSYSEVPDAASILHAKASILERLGQIDEAHQIIKALLTEGTESIPDGLANVYARLCHKFDECDQALAMIHNSLNKPDLDIGVKSSLLFTLGRLQDHLHNYEEAFAAAQEANDLKPYKYDHDKYTDYINQLIKPELTSLATRTSAVNTKHRVRPVFIIGMPRSGTSLVEQIISSHPIVIAGGERHEIGSLVSKLPSMDGVGGSYPECLARLTPELINNILTGYDDFAETLPSDISVMTDKMPENFSHLTFIKMLFPDAKIIHCVRNPIDTCLSIYFRQFAGYHDYAYDLEDLGNHYNEYKRLMNFYRDETDISFMEVVYEDLVNNTEEISRKMVEHCGLEWDEQCLRYYESDQIVRTASYEQAKQPVYTSSIDKWKHYEPQLQPLLDALELPE
jgi:tetratricopeptide (TPR) repeat protein